MVENTLLKNWFLDLMLSKMCHDFSIVSRFCWHIFQCFPVIKPWHDFHNRDTISKIVTRFYEPFSSYFTIFHRFMFRTGFRCKHESCRYGCHISNEFNV